MHGQDGEGSSDDDSSGAERVGAATSCAGITSPLSPCCEFCLGDSDAAEHTSSSSDTDDGTDSSEAHAAEVDGEAASDVDEEVEPLSGAKRLQGLSEDDYEETAEPAVDIAELIKYALFRMGKLA